VHNNFHASMQEHFTPGYEFLWITEPRWTQQW